ncbi:MAG: ATP-binding cassette domain-containing protein [Myxococcaceae bacterium]|jgi:phospholipid/cholesterol/gamma-HCH transport system ATP-binding protein|nr:ATP-binding cassette domain-containing protein [Myxococcaceae bacterium]MCA3013165.1 ATP-binding cassette domain-containing protein [Myxococcaceae bacterium]
MGELVLDGVVKRFGEATVLEGLSVTIPLKGLTFIVGRSGSGKSVLCRLAVGLLRPDAGAVTLLGQRVDTLPERRLVELRAQVPYLVQGPALLDWLTLEANVALAAKGASDPARVEAALGRMGLLALRNRFPPQVGPGIRKRAAIARALVLQPTCLLLDEPTTGLDATAAGQVNEALEAVREAGLGALVVSHDYVALARLADRVVEVRQGVVGYQGPKAGFLAGAR